MAEILDIKLPPKTIVLASFQLSLQMSYYK